MKSSSSLYGRPEQRLLDLGLVKVGREEANHGDLAFGDCGLDWLLEEYLLQSCQTTLYNQVQDD